MLIWPKKQNIIKYKQYIFIYKNGWRKTFNNIDIEKIKFYHHKTPIFWGDVDLKKVLVSNKIFFGEKTVLKKKTFLKTALLVTCIMIIKLSHYIYFFLKQVKIYDEQTKWIYFLIEDDDLLENYNTIWDQVSADIKKKNLIASLSIIKIIWKTK